MPSRPARPQPGTDSYCDFHHERKCPVDCVMTVKRPWIGLTRNINQLRRSLFDLPTIRPSHRRTTAAACLLWDGHGVAYFIIISAMIYLKSLVLTATLCMQSRCCYATSLTLHCEVLETNEVGFNSELYVENYTTMQHRKSLSVCYRVKADNLITARILNIWQE